MSRNPLLALVTFAAIISLPQAALAAVNEGTGSLLDYAGILVGGELAHPDGKLRPTLGIDGGIQIQPWLGVGGFVGVGTEKVTHSDETSGTYTFAAEANYFADTVWIGSRIGIKSGVVWGPATHSLDAVLGPWVGYDYAIGNGFSAGAEASLLLISTAPLSEAASILFAGRYWF